MINKETTYTLEKSRMTLTVDETNSTSKQIVTGALQHGMINDGSLNEYIDTLITELQELRDSI